MFYIPTENVQSFQFQSNYVFHKRTKNHIIFQGPVQFVIIKNLKNKICPHKVEVRALRVSLRLECTQLNTFCTQVLRILELK